MKDTSLPRVLLGLSALVLLAGGAIHAAAFPSAAPVMDGAAMPDFFIAAYKALWLADSGNLFALALLYAFLAWHPAAASPAVVALTGLGPLTVGLLIYAFMGTFFAGHLMMASAVLALAAAAASLRAARRAG